MCFANARSKFPISQKAGFALPVTFFQKTFESSAHQIVQPVTESEVTDLMLKSHNTEDEPFLSSIQEICSITDEETGYEGAGVAYETAFILYPCTLRRTYQY